MPPELGPKDEEKADRLDMRIADAEQRVSEQALRFERLVFDGQDTRGAMETLRVLEDILFGYMKARAALGESQPTTTSSEM